MELDGYIRVSKVGKRKKKPASFISPEQQREQIEGWAKLRGVMIANWETDLDKPGPKLSRPGFDRILGRIETGATGGIAVAKIDRLSRAGVADALKLVEKIIEQGGTLAAIDLGIDPTTPFGEFALTLMLGLARMESRRIGDMWLDARTRAVDRGVHISGHEPLGYLRRDSGVLYPDPSTSWAVKEAFSLRARGSSWKAIADWLTEERVTTRHGAPQWTVATVRTMILNRVYLGEARSGDLVKLGAHPPIVAEPVWIAANRKQGSAPAASGNASGMLSGIARCAGCSFALKVSMNKDRDGTPKREYRCKPDKAAGRCPAPTSARADALEHYVVARFFEDYGEIAAAAQKRTDERSGIEARLAGSRAEFAAALDERLADALGGAEAEIYIETVRLRREAVEADEEALANVEDDSDGLPAPTTVRANWETRTVQQKRALLGMAYDGVFLRRARSPREPIADRVRLFTAGTGPPLPQRGRRSEIRSIDVD